MHTTQTFQYLEKTFEYYNKKLFDSKLPDVVFSISRDNKMSGIFHPSRWETKESNPVHEIAVNPDCIEPFDIEFHQMIVHEMCHLYQFVFGTPGKNGYHNKEFFSIMERVGLHATTTGTMTGSTTGYRMGDFPIEGGEFIKAFQKLQESKFKPLEIKPVKHHQKNVFLKSGKRYKYSCSCKNNIWGKSGMHIICKDCGKDFVEN